MLRGEKTKAYFNAVIIHQVVHCVKNFVLFTFPTLQIPLEQGVTRVGKNKRLGDFCVISIYWCNLQTTKSIANDLLSLHTGSSISFGPHIFVHRIYHVDFLNVFNQICQKAKFFNNSFDVSYFFLNSIFFKDTEEKFLTFLCNFSEYHTLGIAICLKSVKIVSK